MNLNEFINVLVNFKIKFINEIEISNYDIEFRNLVGVKFYEVIKMVEIKKEKNKIIINFREEK